MDSQLPETVFSSRTLAAFAVHVFTACGAACALLALIAAASADWTQMFLWLGVALIVDGVDGTFARHLHVAELLPRWSGDVLDFVVDYGTYVLVPAYAIATGGVLPSGAALPLGLIVAVTGAIYFADRRMKTSDSYFRGFPALWNCVLSVSAQARALVRGARRSRAGRGDVRADLFRSSGARAALADGQSRGARVLGGARGLRAGAASRSARVGRRRARRHRDLFRDRWPLAFAAVLKVSGCWRFSPTRMRGLRS